METLLGVTMEDINIKATYRELIRHENDLMNHRITWLITAHGLLFAAIALVWDKNGGRLLIAVLSALGVLISISSATVLQAAKTAIILLLEDSHDNKQPPVIGWSKSYRRDKESNGQSQSDHQSERQKKRQNIQDLYELLYPWNMLPLVFTVAWIFILIYTLMKAS